MMLNLETFLTVAVVVAFLIWIALSLHVLSVQGRRVSARRLVARVIAFLERDDVRRLAPIERGERLRPLAARASRELIMRATADRDTPETVFDPLVRYFVDRWGLQTLVKDASTHRSPREKWRRITALRILHRMNHAEAMSLLARAVDQLDPDVAGTALSVLGTSSDPRAMEILFGALRSQRHAASRVAVHLEQSPLPLAAGLKTGLHDSNPVVRLWSATLLARYPDEHLELELAALADDPDPRVRKAVIQTLGKTGDAVATDCALRLLTDPFPYVRAHAARALGELNRTDHSERVAMLLGDTDWWARLAAKESLEMMGPEVWPVLMRNLNHADRFVRNGAAEVFQNLGVLDSLIVMEAATDNPAPTKIDMLRRIAGAGGVSFTDSLIERAGPIVGPRIRHLLTTIGLEHVGAA